MLLIAKRRDLKALEEAIKAAGTVLESARFKKIMGQSQSLLDKDDWFWLKTAIKALYFTPENPRKTLYTRYLNPPKAENAKLSQIVHLRLTQSEAAWLRSIAQTHNCTVSDVLRKKLFQDAIQAGDRIV